MTKQEIESYQNMGIPVGRKRKRHYTFTPHELVEYVLIFLLNKIYILGGISPFGLSFIGAVLPKQKKPFGIVAAALGILAADMGVVSLKYLGALVIFSAFCILMDKEFSAHPWLYPTVVSLSVLLTGTVYVITEGFLLYDLMLLLLETAMAFLSYYLWEKSDLVLQGLSQRRVFEPRESVCLLSLCAGCILSFSSVPQFEGLAHVLSLLVIFVAGLCGGLTFSSVASLVLGVVNSISSVLPAQVVAVYGVAGLFSGLMRKKGRLGVVLAFFLANIFSAVYFSGSANRIVAFYYVFAAGAILFLIPDRFLKLFGEVLQSSQFEEDSAQRLRTIMHDKLQEVSRSFDELSVVFSKAVDTRVETEMRDPGHLYDKTANQVCKHCTLAGYCWQKDFEFTRQALSTLFTRMERKGRAEEEDMPDKFRRGCIRREAFLKALNQNYELYKINLLWAGRVLESRHLVAEQFKNVSAVLSNLQEELTADPKEAMMLERRVCACLDREGISFQKVRVYAGEGLTVQVTTEEPIREDKEISSMVQAVSNAIESPVSYIPDFEDEEKTRFTFREKSRFSMVAGFAKMAAGAGAKSGDQLLCSPSEGGKFIMALSDGMGQGSGAEAQSSMTVHLIRKLLAAGFDKETVLKLINTMLMVSSSEDSFATADMCLANLYSGALEFIKIGAASSYVKRGNQVEKISSTSLPAGILRDIEADCDLKYGLPGDFVIMLTDGITDVLDKHVGSKLENIIKTYTGDSPQHLAEEILHHALLESGGTPKDDMTVLVAKMERAS